MTKRERATRAEMAHRHAAIMQLAREHQPCTVRQIFYRAVVAGLEGITKDDRGYEKVQQACLKLRRSGAIDYSWVVDTSRSVYRVPQWSSIESYLHTVAGSYRRDLWEDAEVAVEVWCESESIASTIRDTCWDLRVPLFPTRGQCSETYAFEATRSWPEDRQTVVLYIGDHDPAGLDIEAALQDKLTEHGEGLLADFRRLGVTWDQVEALGLPGTPPKIRSASQRQRYRWPESVEAEALPPGMVRELVADAVGAYLDPAERRATLEVERFERAALLNLRADDLLAG